MTQPKPPSDDNSKLLEEWFKDKHPFLLAYLHKTLDKNKVTRQDIQDCVQEAWLALRKRRGSLLRVTNLEAYLVTTCKRVAMRLIHRRTQEHAALLIDPADHSDGVLSELIIKEGLLHVLASMSERHQTLLKMKYVAGMTTTEIAETSGRKVDSVERELTTARRLLTPLLANHLKGRQS